MSEYKKWFSKDGSLIPEPGDAGYEGFVKRRKAWYAALEWALVNKKPIKYNAYKFDYIKTDVIEEELKNLNQGV